MKVLTKLDRRGGLADAVSVLDDRIALVEVFKSDFVPERNVRQRR